MFFIKQNLKSYAVFVCSLSFVLFSSTPLLAQTAQPGNILNQPVLGEHKILLIRVQYPGDEGGIVSDAVMANVAAVIKETLETNSYGAVTISTDITPVLRMPQPDTYYEFEEPRGPGPTLMRIRADAISLAEQSGYQTANYDREIIYTRKLWKSPAIGYGTVNFRTAFMGCACDYTTVHEIGHSFDWKHANFWHVEQGSPISPEGREINYGDAFDIMGDQIPGLGRSFHHFNPWYKSRVGWLPEANILTVTQNGTYTVQALEKTPDAQSPVQKYSALRIKKDAEIDYWVFYRAEEEFANTGALITQGFHTNRRATLLLDMTPGTGNEEWKDAALTMGHIFYDPHAGVEIKLLSKTADTLQVQVFVPPDSLGSVPLINVVTPTRGVTLTGTVFYEVTAFDPDSGAANGAGIASVKLELENTLAEKLAQIFADTLLTAPPYVLDVDTTPLNDDVYFLLVTAVDTDGDTTTIRFPHIIDNTGPSLPTSIEDKPVSVPERFQLFQNYPNPFNPSTTIRYDLASSAHVSLKIFNLLGQEIVTLVDEQQTAGAKSVMWNGNDDYGLAVASGVYLYQLEIQDFVQTRKMLLLQ